VSAPRIKPAPAGMTGTWNHARFLRACRAVGINSAPDLARYVNAVRASSGRPTHHPNESAAVVVRSYFDARPNVLAKPRDVSAAWPAGRVAVQQAMHRMMKAGELVRAGGGAYHLSSASPPFIPARSLAIAVFSPSAARAYWSGEHDPTRSAVGRRAVAFELAVALNVSLDWLVSEDPQ
jgi:hypothetical protein